METNISFDLDDVGDDERRSSWENWVAEAFPGLRVSQLEPDQKLSGSISGTMIDSGILWVIQSPTITIEGTARLLNTDRRSFGLLTQRSGSTRVSQGSHTSVLHPGDMCFIDGDQQFKLTIENGELTIFQCRRSYILARYPFFRDWSARSVDRNTPGCQIVRGVIDMVANNSEDLDPLQRYSAFATILQALGTLERPSLVDAEGIHIRVLEALEYIHHHAADPAVDANIVAQTLGLSRRRLDSLFTEQTGRTLSSTIWNRRLENAATSLRDERLRNRTITQIGFDCGFNDAGHFSRTFKRHFDCTPSEWRKKYPPK